MKWNALPPIKTATIHSFLSTVARSRVTEHAFVAVAVAVQGAHASSGGMVSHRIGRVS